MLKTRILTALLLLPLMLAALFGFSPSAWAVFAALVTGLALWEFTRMAKMPRIAQAGYLLLSAVVALSCWIGRVHIPMWGHVGVLAFWLLVVPLWLKRRWVLAPGVLSGLLGWVMLFPAWFAMLDWRAHANRNDACQLLAIMALVWIADVAAYFSGKAFGRRKLAPSISPGKSWEGVLGALFAVGVYALLVGRMGWVELPLAPWQLLLLALPLTMVSVAGDLLESWFKRCAGMKDSSRLLPGHGGVYDRIDSLIAVLAVSNALRILGGW
jgi:phosphatidate cytidylyltransferase